jgi:hypothetical protein
MHGALNEPGGLELAQASRQKAVGETGHTVDELGEEVRPLGEHPDDRPGPALADQLDRGVKLGGDVGGVSVRATRRAFESRPRFHGD